MIKQRIKPGDRISVLLKYIKRRSKVKVKGINNELTDGC